MPTPRPAAPPVEVFTALKTAHKWRCILLSQPPFCFSSQRKCISGAQGAPRNSDTAALPRGQFSCPHKRFTVSTERLTTCSYGPIYESVAGLPTGTAAPAAHLRFCPALAPMWLKTKTPADSVSKIFFSWISFESKATSIRIFKIMGPIRWRVINAVFYIDCGEQ